MNYGKLYAILLSTMDSEKQSGINQHIARFILEHVQDPAAISVKNIAAMCHASPAAISRFCRDIGLQDFFELRELIEDCHYQSEIDHSPTFSSRLHVYRSNIISGLDDIVNSVSEDDIFSLCQAIHQHKKVAALGLLKSESAALVLQTELAALGKNISTALSHRQQIEYLRQATQDDLLIILSYRGIFFDYFSTPDLQDLLSAPTVYFLTGSPDAAPTCADHVIRFHSQFAQSQHPYQLLFLCNIIAREYARIYGLPK